MPFGTLVQTIGTSQVNTASTSLTFTLPTGTATTLGDTLTLHVGTYHAATTVADTRANTWKIDSQTINGTSSVIVCSTILTTALAAGDTITVTLATAATAGLLLLEWSGGMVLDQSATGSGSTSALDGGTTPATTSATDLILGVFAVSGTAAAHPFTPAAGFTALTSVGATSFVRTVDSEYQLSSTTGAQDATATASSATEWAGLTLAYKPTATGQTGQAAVTAAGTLSTAGVASLTGGATLPATASLTASSSVLYAGSVALDAASGVTVSSAAAHTATVGTSSTATLTATGSAARYGTVSMAAAGSLSAAGDVRYAAAVAFAAAAALTAGAGGSVSAAAAVAATASTTTVGTVAHTTTAFVTATGTQTVSGTTRYAATIALSAAGTLTASTAPALVVWLPASITLKLGPTDTATLDPATVAVTLANPADTATLDPATITMILANRAPTAALKPGPANSLDLDPAATEVTLDG